MVKITGNIKAFTLIEVLVAMIILVSSFAAAGIVLNKRNTETDIFQRELATQRLESQLSGINESEILLLGDKEWKDERFTYVFHSEYFENSNDLVLIRTQVFDENKKQIVIRNFLRKISFQ